MKPFKAIPFALLSLALILTFTACVEDDIPMITDPTASETPAAPNPEVGPGDGAFWAIKSITTVTTPITLDTEVGTAVAVFTNNNFNSFIEAGEVTILDEALTKNENNSYVYIPGTSQPLGLSFSGDYQWKVAGAGTVAAFDHTVDFDFPGLGMITSGNTVTKADGYTLTCQNVSKADSIIYSVGGVLKTVGGEVTSVEFTAADLADVSTGSSYIQIAAYTYRPVDKNGKTYYFGNETVRSQVVEIK